LRRHRFALKQFWFCASFQFLLRAMFQFWFAPRFSSGARLGLIGIRTLEARWRGHSRRLGCRHDRGAGILVTFVAALLSGAP